MLRRFVYLLLLPTVIASVSCNGTATEKGKLTPTKTSVSTGGYKITEYHPFSLLDDPRNTIAVYIYNEEEDPLLQKYSTLFIKYGYSGNGETWAGHIVQILKEVNPSLVRHIEFDPEAGAFFAYTNSKKHQIEFAETLVPVFNNHELLEQYIAKANRNQIWD